jgi:hypothetical protein
MDPKLKNENGLKLLKQMYRKRFRIPENTEHYSNEDYRRAEKKYVKLCLMTGNCKQ